MNKQKIETTEIYKSSLSKKCEAVYTFFKVVFCINIFVWVVLVTLCAVALFNPENAGKITVQYWITSVSYLAIGTLFTFVLWFALRIFRDVTRSCTPFSKQQVKRMRYIALLLMVFAFIDLALSSGLFNPSVFLNISLGYTDENGLREPLVAGYVGAFISAIVVYGFSVVFEYGEKIQTRSDEII